MLIKTKDYINICLILFLLACTSLAIGQESQDSSQINRSKLSAFPLAFFLPETGFGFGGLGIYTFRMPNEHYDSRPSLFQLGMSYTTRRQILFFAPYELYWSNQSYRAVGELGFYVFFYNFYGLGIDTDVGNLETYDVSYPRFRGTMYHEVKKNFSIGIS